MKPCPCNGCSKRYPGCHSECKGEGSYQEWKAERDALLEKHRAIRKAQYDIDNQIINNVYKRKKKKKR